MIFRLRHIVVFLMGLIILNIIIFQSNSFVDKVKIKEKVSMKIFSQALEELGSSENFGKDVSLLLSIVKNNKSIPVIILDKRDNIKDFKNIDYSKIKTKKLLRKQIEMMRAYQPPIAIDLDGDDIPDQYVYYNESNLLNGLTYYPFIIIFMVLFLVFFIYYILLTTKKGEQNKTWAAMAKETAHQIGTPLSSIIGWLEFLKMEPIRNKQVLSEIKNDLTRLQVITDRFSKIGTKPIFEEHNIVELIQNNIYYLQQRLSDKTNIKFRSQQQEDYIKINKYLFEWVLENMIKNSVDSMKGQGTITIEIESTTEKTKIYIKDTGKGIPKMDFQKIFDMGFTTKKRGWGLGLSLVKRIIQDYHKARVYVVKSIPNQETVFAISFLKKKRTKRETIWGVAKDILSYLKIVKNDKNAHRQNAKIR